MCVCVSLVFAALLTRLFRPRVFVMCMCVCVCVCERVCMCVCVCVCFAIRCHCGSANSFWPHNGQNALSEPHKIDTLVMSHSLIRSPVRSHRSLTRSLGTACFARAPQRSFARSLAHSLAPELVGQWNIFVQNSVCPESQWNDNEIDAWSTGPFTRPLAHSQNSEFDQ